MGDKEKETSERLYDLFVNDIDKYIRETKKLPHHQVVHICMPIVIRFQRSHHLVANWWAPIFGDEIFDITFDDFNEDSHQESRITDHVMEIISEKIGKLFNGFSSIQDLHMALIAKGFRVSGKDKNNFDYAMRFDELDKIFIDQKPDYIETTTFRPEVVFS